MCHHVTTLHASFFPGSFTSHVRCHAVTLRHDPCSTLHDLSSVLVLPIFVYKSHSQLAQIILVGTCSFYLGSLLSGYRVIRLLLSLRLTGSG